MHIDAPPQWGCVDFISDLHLHAADTATFTAWSRYLHDTTADAVFILGDLFEVWVGDDATSDPASFEARCTQVIAEAAARRPVYIMHGNRDFLMGLQLMAACGAQLLPDPCVLVFAGERWLLTHGDALCLDDLPYQEFRASVRSAAWQQAFLAKSLAERQQIARALRDQSEAHKAVETQYADVDSPAAIALLREANARHMIHGHTHRPGHHDLGKNLERTVLSDWDLQAQTPRAEVLRITASASAPERVRRISPAVATTARD
jgi:UDP-2,3-diacylglucosamine hydrolase